MGRPADLIGEALPRTVSLAVLSFVAAVAIAPPTGIISAVRRYSTADHVVTVFALLGLSMPSSWPGIVLTPVFAVTRSIKAWRGDARA
jgi:peptide/nickel transport system permease protein